MRTSLPERSGETRLRSKAQRTVVLASGLALVLVLALQPQAGAQDEIVDKISEGTTELVSISSQGEQGDGDSGQFKFRCEPAGSPEGNQRPNADTGREYSASDNGRFIAFVSYAGNLHPADVNGSIPDVFVFDRKKQKLDLVSVLPTGLVPDIPASDIVDLCFFWSLTPAISGNGRYVAFESTWPLTGIEGEPTSVTPLIKIFVRDLKTQTTELVSRDVGGEIAVNARTPTISDNGRFVAFQAGFQLPTDCGVLDPIPDDSCPQVYVRDRRASETTLVSRSSSGESANYTAEHPFISGNGRFVVFQSEATNLTPNDGNTCPEQVFEFRPAPSCRDVFIHDVRTRETELISISRDRASANSWSIVPNSTQAQQIISDDGRFVVFYSKATDLVPANPLLSPRHVYVRDRRSQRTDRVSVSSTGTILGVEQGDFIGRSHFSSISDDGRYVPFSSGSDAVQGEQAVLGSFIHDSESGQVDWRTWLYANGNTKGAPPGTRIDYAVIGGNGRFLVGTGTDACRSTRTGARPTCSAGGPPNVKGDRNDAVDVFVRDFWAKGLEAGHLRARSSSPSITGPSRRSFATTGRATFKDSPDDALVAGLGAEILETRIVHRPELDDLFLRIDVEHMFGSAHLIGLTPYPVIYGARITTGSGTYELRVRGHGGDPSSGGGIFGLFECEDTACTEVAKLRGGFGTVGEAVVTAIPLRLLDLDRGGEITDLRAFAGPGTYELGLVRVLDAVGL